MTTSRKSSGSGVAKVSSRASATRSWISAVNSTSCAVTSPKMARRSDSDSMPLRWSAASSSMLVRRLVSGVRSSCPASAISWACRSREELSERSIWLNDSASRARSPVASISMGVSSVVAVICSTAAESWRTGRRLDRAMVTPTIAAITTPATPKMISTAHSELRMLFVGSSGRPMTIAKPPGSSPRGTATMRYSTPASDTPERAEKPRPSRAIASSSGPRTRLSRASLPGPGSGLAGGTKKVLPSARIAATARSAERIERPVRVLTVCRSSTTGPRASGAAVVTSSSSSAR